MAGFFGMKMAAYGMGLGVHRIARDRFANTKPNISKKA
jgi:hypothetical protein